MRAKKLHSCLLFCLRRSADSAPDRSFHLMETPIADIHEVMHVGTLTCHNLVQQYLARIHDYDQLRLPARPRASKMAQL
jgi:hypothetical protein